MFQNYSNEHVVVVGKELNSSRQEQDVQVHNLQASLGSLQTKLLVGEEELREQQFLSRRGRRVDRNRFP